MSGDSREESEAPRRPEVGTIRIHAKRDDGKEEERTLPVDSVEAREVCLSRIWRPAKPRAGKDAPRRYDRLDEAIARRTPAETSTGHRDQAYCLIDTISNCGWANNTFGKTLLHCCFTAWEEMSASDMEILKSWGKISIFASSIISREQVRIGLIEFAKSKSRIVRVEWGEVCMELYALRGSVPIEYTEYANNEVSLSGERVVERKETDRKRKSKSDTPTRVSAIEIRGADLGKALLRQVEVGPKAAISEIAEMLKELDDQQAPYRERLGEMLRSLKGNREFSNEERQKFVRSFNELLDRLGLALYLEGDPKPVRLGVKSHREKIVFRLTQGAKCMKGSMSLWGNLRIRGQKGD